MSKTKRWKLIEIVESSKIVQSGKKSDRELDLNFVDYGNNKRKQNTGDQGDQLDKTEGRSSDEDIQRQKEEYPFQRDKE